MAAPSPVPDSAAEPPLVGDATLPAPPLLEGSDAVLLRCRRHCDTMHIFLRGRVCSSLPGNGVSLRQWGQRQAHTSPMTGVNSDTHPSI